MHAIPEAKISRRELNRDGLLDQELWAQGIEEHSTVKKKATIGQAIVPIHFGIEGTRISDINGPSCPDVHNPMEPGCASPKASLSWGGGKCPTCDTA